MKADSENDSKMDRWLQKAVKVTYMAFALLVCYDQFRPVRHPPPPPRRATHMALYRMCQELCTYYVTTNQYPANLADLAIWTNGQKGHETLETNDGWGHPVEYVVSNDTFTLRSVGADGQKETKDDFILKFDKEGMRMQP